METLLALPIALIVLVIGAAIGSFLNVVVYRLPAGMSLVWPPSRCPHCLHRLRSFENVPVLGWLWLKGRCARCQQPIAVRYPLVEAATGLLFLLVFFSFGLSWQTVGGWAFFSWLLALSLIDLDTLTLPNPLTQSGLVAGLGFQLVLGLYQTADAGNAIAHLITGDRLMTGGILGAVIGLWLLDGFSVLGAMLFRKPAMGGGDAKLAAMMGAWLGWKYLLVAGFLACVIGAFGGGGAIALGWVKRHQPIPFGPALALGAAIALLWGETILSAYLQLFFPTIGF